MKILITAVSLSLLSTFALADNTKEDAVAVSETTRIQFEILDADQNGEITKKEALASEKLSSKFAELDVDSNGNLDRAEFSQFYETEGK